MSATIHPPMTMDNIEEIFANDNKVKVAGVDADGVLRGKFMAKDKFLASIEHGFGMSSAIFGWDMHDVLYAKGNDLASVESGYADLIAVPDLSTFRRQTWENNVPLVLLYFRANGEGVHADGRGMLASLCDLLRSKGMQSLTGVELEFINFQVSTEDGFPGSQERLNLAAFLEQNAPAALRPLTGDMFGYSASLPAHNKDYFHDVFDRSEEFRCNLEGWHTESGPGVYEAALKLNEVSEMADRGSLFKLLAKSSGLEHKVAPCVMAKPISGLPGNSGHIHISLTDLRGKNLFTRETKELSAEWSDIAHLSDEGRYFLAGILEALPDIMPLLAPTINSYKRLVENYWAPVFVNWGLEDRMSSVRIIAPPTCKPSATRLEIRVPGADLHPHYALTALLAAGWPGIEHKRAIPVPPSSVRTHKPARLPRDLGSAVDRLSALNSIAREIMGSRFVDFFTTSRRHELDTWSEAVTDWEFKRYVETV